MTYWRQSFEGRVKVVCRLHVSVDQQREMSLDIARRKENDDLVMLLTNVRVRCGLLLLVALLVTIKGILIVNFRKIKD